MKTVKTWKLRKPFLSECDSVWIVSNSDNLNVVNDTCYPVTEYGYDFKNPVAGPSEILITTSCEKQESMLQLKYGNLLILQRIRNYVDI